MLVKAWVPLRSFLQRGWRFGGSAVQRTRHEARQGSASPGTARQGTAWPGSTRRGAAWKGVVVGTWRRQARHCVAGPGGAGHVWSRQDMDRRLDERGRAVLGQAPHGDAWLVKARQYPACRGDAGLGTAGIEDLDAHGLARQWQCKVGQRSAWPVLSSRGRRLEITRRGEAWYGLSELGVARPVPAGHGLGDAVLGAARPVGAVRGWSCLGTDRRERQGEASASPRQARHVCARRGMEWQGVGWAKHGRAGLRLARRGRARIGSGGGYVAGLIAAMQGSSGQGGARPVMAYNKARRCCAWQHRACLGKAARG
jgi:hypothetical protein